MYSQVASVSSTWASASTTPTARTVRAAPFIELLSFPALCISELLIPWLRDRADGVIGLLNGPGVNIPGVQDRAVGRHPGVWRGPTDSSGQRQLVERIEERQQGKFAGVQTEHLPLHVEADRLFQTGQQPIAQAVPCRTGVAAAVGASPAILGRRHVIRSDSAGNALHVD